MKGKNGIFIFFLLLVMKPAFAAEPNNYATLWRSWDNVAREAYIRGVVDGVAQAVLVTMQAVMPKTWPKKPEPKRVKEKVDTLFVRDTMDLLPDVITDIYKDPANAFIEPIDMFFLARDKIEGKDITTGIMAARKRAIDTYRLNEELRGK